MKNKKKIIVVMPARNVEKTLEKTFRDIPRKSINEIILVDNKSSDDTVQIAKRLGITVIKHNIDKGYGGSQKTLYKKAKTNKADVVVMVHPDYQYDATLLPQLIQPILSGKKDIMFGSRMRSKNGALKGGMPVLKYWLNKIYCKLENIILGVNFTEHFSGFRAYNIKVLKTLPFSKFSNDYIFDQQLMISAIAAKMRIGEISIPTRYFSEASSIDFIKGSKFLAETLKMLAIFLLYKYKLAKNKIFEYEMEE